ATVNGNLTMTGVTLATGANTLTLGGDVATNASGTTASITGNLALASGTRTFNIADGTAATDLSITAGISGTGGNLLKSGAGLLVLTGTNTYSGTTTISGGTVQIGNGAATGTLGTGAVTDNA